MPFLGCPEAKNFDNNAPEKKKLKMTVKMP